jgi:hypothetical protein
MNEERTAPIPSVLIMTVASFFALSAGAVIAWL